jgi:hypothetical protein
MEELLKRHNLTSVKSPIATNKRGESFVVGESVLMADYPVVYKTIVGEELEVLDIFACEHSQSGFMLYVIHKATQNKFRSLLDANWFQKFKNKQQ